MTTMKKMMIIIRMMMMMRQCNAKKATITNSTTAQLQLLFLYKQRYMYVRVRPSVCLLMKMMKSILYGDLKKLKHTPTNTNRIATLINCSSLKDAYVLASTPLVYVTYTCSLLHSLLHATTVHLVV